MQGPWHTTQCLQDIGCQHVVLPQVSIDKINTRCSIGRPSDRPLGGKGCEGLLAHVDTSAVGIYFISRGPANGAEKQFCSMVPCNRLSWMRAKCRVIRFYGLPLEARGSGIFNFD